MGPDLLVPIAGMMTAVAIVGFGTAAKTVRYYLDWRMRMTERELGGRDQSLAQMIAQLRAEIAALKQHEAEAILSFDSTLQTLDARLKHLEQTALGDGGAERAALGAAAPRVEQPAQQAIKSG
jgi:hypothetical protein